MGEYLIAVKQHGMVFALEKAFNVVIIVLAGRMSRLSRHQNAQRFVPVTQVSNKSEWRADHPVIVGVHDVAARSPDRVPVPSYWKGSAVEDPIQRFDAAQGMPERQAVRSAPTPIFNVRSAGFPEMSNRLTHGLVDQIVAAAAITRIPPWGIGIRERVQQPFL